MRRAAIPRLRALGAPLRGLHAWLWLTPLNGQPPGPFFPRANACHGQSWCLCAAQALRPTPTRPTPPLRAQFAALIHTGSAEWLVPIKRNSDFDTTTPFASVEEACAHVARLRRAAGGAPLPSGPTAAGLLSAERLGRWRRPRARRRRRSRARRRRRRARRPRCCVCPGVRLRVQLQQRAWGACGRSGCRAGTCGRCGPALAPAQAGCGGAPCVSAGPASRLNQQHRLPPWQATCPANRVVSN